MESFRTLSDVMRELQLQDVSKVFLTPADRHVIALKNINVSIKDGEFLAVIGPTGCGKTTLLRILAGLEKPSTGRILVDGEPATGRNGFSTLVFQQYSLFPWMDVQRNVEFPLEMLGIPRERRARQARDLLALVGLASVEKALPYELSGGMQQRVAIARALAANPEMLLMDEPFGALDERTRHHLQDVLLEIWKAQRKTIVFVTHNIDEALYLADRLAVMATAPGRILKEVAVELPRPRNRLSQEFTQLHLQIRNHLEALIQDQFKEEQ